MQIDAWPLISQTGEQISASKPVRFVSEDAFFPTSTARSIRKGGMKHRRSTFDGMINCSRTRKKSCVACGWAAGCSRLLHCILSGMHAPPTVGVMPDSYDTSKCTGGTWAIRLSRETAQRTSQGAMWSGRGLPAVRVGTLEVEGGRLRHYDDRGCMHSRGTPLPGLIFVDGRPNHIHMIFTY